MGGEQLTFHAKRGDQLGAVDQSQPLKTTEETNNDNNNNNNSNNNNDSNNNNNNNNIDSLIN